MYSVQLNLFLTEEVGADSSSQLHVAAFLTVVLNERKNMMPAIKKTGKPTSHETIK